MSKVIFGYWDTRGLAEPARLLLEFCEVPYEDKRFVCGDAPEFDCSCWNDVKLNLGLEFPNLPYLVSDDVHLTESSAILKHIARKSKRLVPKDDAESDRCDMIEGVAIDFRRDFTNLCYRPKPDFETNKATFFAQNFPNKLKKLENYLEGKTWVAGSTLTYVDFILAELLDQIQIMLPGCYEKYANVSYFLKRFFELEKVKSYRESDRFKKFPINNKTAIWGKIPERSA